VILVRDTTDRDGFTLSVPAETWLKFTATIKLAERNTARTGRVSLTAPADVPAERERPIER
jgi:hypothetical protein